MSAPAKVKKRITPTLIAPAAVQAPVEEEDVSGPKGPRKNPLLLKKGGAKAREVHDILHGNPQLHKNPWVHHVKQFAKVNNLPYACALSNPNIKVGYEKGSFTRAKTLASNIKAAPVQRKETIKKSGKKTEAGEAKKHAKYLSKLYGKDYEQEIANRQADRRKGGGTLGASFLDELEKRAPEYDVKYKKRI